MAKGIKHYLKICWRIWSIYASVVTIVLILLFILADDSVEENIGGYTLNIDNFTIYGKNAFIPSKVLEYGYDEDFIIAAQYAYRLSENKDECEKKHGINRMYYWIIDKRNDIVIGPMNYHEYTATRDSLNIKLEFERL